MRVYQVERLNPAFVNTAPQSVKNPRTIVEDISAMMHQEYGSFVQFYNITADGMLTVALFPTAHLVSIRKVEK